MEARILNNVYIKAVTNVMERKGWNKARLSEATGINNAMIGRYLKNNEDNRVDMPLGKFLILANKLGYESVFKEIDELIQNHGLQVSFQVLKTKEHTSVHYGVFVVDGRVVASGHLVKENPYIYVREGDSAVLPLDTFLMALKKGTGFNGKFEKPVVMENDHIVEVNKISFENWMVNHTHKDDIVDSVQLIESDKVEED